jgi:hypothetical protein
MTIYLMVSTHTVSLSDTATCTCTIFEHMCQEQQPFNTPFPSANKGLSGDCHTRSEFSPLIDLRSFKLTSIYLHLKRIPLPDTRSSTRRGAHCQRNLSSYLLTCIPLLESRRFECVHTRFQHNSTQKQNQAFEIVMPSAVAYATTN